MMPSIIIFLIIGAIAAVAVFFGTPKGRGYFGEMRIRLILGKTKPGKKYVINNYMIEEKGRSSQIDHILINKYGIFVIETKNYSGRIYGSESRQEWTQVLSHGKVKNHFYNPIKQNRTHVYRLARVLPKNAPLFSVVVFVKDNTAYIDAPDVIGASKLRRFVKSHREILMDAEQMQTCYNRIIENKSEVSEKEHIAEIKQMQADVRANVCPRCGGNLVERNGKYGKFFGCENYPKCRFIKK